MNAEPTIDLPIENKDAHTLRRPTHDDAQHLGGTSLLRSGPIGTDHGAHRASVRYRRLPAAITCTARNAALTTATDAASRCPMAMWPRLFMTAGTYACLMSRCAQGGWLVGWFMGAAAVCDEN